jgi:cytochrome c peroxidase
MFRRLLIACSAGFLSAIVAVTAQTPAYVWDLPPGFTAPRVPADNPMSDAGVQLGRHLFYDTRLSGNGTQACATCHKQELAFTDGKAHGVGSTGEVNPRSSMSLVNIAYASALTWADPKLTLLEDQARVPMFGEHPVELGLSPTGPWLAALQRDAKYQTLFADAFAIAPDAITVDHVTKAISSFERAIISARSPLDAYRNARDNSLVSDAVRRGETLFHSRPLFCFGCHAGVTFSEDGNFEGRPVRRFEFFNTGLYNVAGTFSYPAEDLGIYRVTQNPQDVGKFKPPTLRNIAVTGPYMHDGSVATLDDAIDHYAAGGRTLSDGPYAGVGARNPNKTILLRGFPITPEQKADLVAFLMALTDEPLLRDPRFSNPWPQKTTEALVFAAGSLQTALDALVQPLERATGIRMKISYAASSALARQIENGAPAELFISADLDWMDYLAERKLIQPASRVNLLGNQLVLIAPKSKPAALEIAPKFRLAAALGRERLALANPDVVPAGKYAKAALTSLGVWDTVAARIAPTENVRAALLLVSRGEAPLGIVYRTDAHADPGVVVVDTFPETTHPPIVYPAALTSTASASAQKILDFLKSDQARKVFDAEGFTVPRRD